MALSSQSAALGVERRPRARSPVYSGVSGGGNSGAPGSCQSLEHAGGEGQDDSARRRREKIREGNSAREGLEVREREAGTPETRVGWG